MGVNRHTWIIIGAACIGGAAVDPAMAQGQAEPPEYRVDPFWPQPLPNNWILGQVASVAVGRDDHVWILQRPRSLTESEAGAVQNPPLSECCVPAPSVIEFDQQGNVVGAWGGPTWNQVTGQWIDPQGGWPAVEHGIFVDGENNVWVGGNGMSDHVVLKFTRTGEHLLTIGVWQETGGSNDTERLGRPADMFVDVESAEVYIADGYGNRRIIVFDSGTGAYKRHWGAYGERPHDSELPNFNPNAEPIRSYRSPVHSVTLSDDKRVYVADRTSNRIQVFRHDGRFLTETILAPRTLGAGSIWDLGFSADPVQRWLFVADGSNRKVWILERSSLAVVGSFGRGGRQAGHFEWLHSVAADSIGNLYTAEVMTGKRIQKFVLASRD